MAARIVDDRDRHVLGLRQRDQVGHRAVDGRAIEAGPHEQGRQVAAERLHVGAAVVEDRRLERRPSRIHEQRQAAEHVARAGVDGDPVAVRAERRGVGGEVREQRIEVLLQRGDAQVRQDRHQALRGGDLGPGLVERMPALRPGHGVEQDQHRRRRGGVARTIDVHPQVAVGLIREQRERRRRGSRIVEPAFLGASDRAEREDGSNGDEGSEHHGIVRAARLAIQRGVPVRAGGGTNRLPGTTSWPSHDSGVEFDSRNDSGVEFDSGVVQSCTRRRARSSSPTPAARDSRQDPGERAGDRHHAARMGADAGDDVVGRE